MKLLLTFAFGVTFGVVTALSLVYRREEEPPFGESEDGIAPIDPYVKAQIDWLYASRSAQ